MRPTHGLDLNVKVVVPGSEWTAELDHVDSIGQSRQSDPCVHQANVQHQFLWHSELVKTQTYTVRQPL